MSVASGLLHALYNARSASPAISGPGIFRRAQKRLALKQSSKKNAGAVGDLLGIGRDDDQQLAMSGIKKQKESGEAIIKTEPERSAPLKNESAGSVRVSLNRGWRFPGCSPGRLRPLKVV